MPTRRRIILCLVLCVTGIVGCGGGVGSSAPVPPVTNPISGGGSVLDQGKAASLFDSIDSRGEAWLGLVDSDSGFFHLTGEDPEVLVDSDPEEEGQPAPSLAEEVVDVDDLDDDLPGITECVSA